jgi:hypothetical protein
MNPVLLMPAALATLAALALPLLIHLARRQQQRPTVFAALRWLRARPRPRRRLRFDEPWLLALRLLLLALLALFLARPALLGVQDLQPRVLVAPGVDAAAVAKAGNEPEVDARWLAPGFPSLDQPQVQRRVPVASLLREFDAALPPGAPLTVLVPERLLGADGARLQLSREVTWRIVPGGTWPDAAESAAPSVAIRHDVAHREGVAYLRALAQAWQEEDEVDVAETAGPPPAGVELLAWLREDPLPDEVARWVEQGGQVLLPSSASRPDGAEPVVVWRDQAGVPLLDATTRGQGRLLQLARPLQPATMPQLLEPAFPQILRDIVQPPPAPTAVAASDYLPQTGARATAPEPHDLRPWFALAIALLFLLERWMASARWRGAPA